MNKELDLTSLTVDEFTTVDLVTGDIQMSAADAKKLMTLHEIRHLPIVHCGNGVGILSEREIHSLSQDQLEKTFVKDIMALDPLTVRSNDLLKDVVFQMSSKKIGSALVTGNDQKLYGIFTSIDALNTIIELL